ncbi:Phosphomevalonate kinase [Fusarium oxysporum f. sp. albedinis]|nr:Phosphomevalonate kinase [Fusarium oxysporum f. sp. albedinis]
MSLVSCKDLLNVCKWANPWSSAGYIRCIGFIVYPVTDFAGILNGLVISAINCQRGPFHCRVALPVSVSVCLSSLSLYRFRQLQGSRLPSSSQAPPRSSFPVRQSVQRPRHHQREEKSTLLHRLSLHTGSTLQPLAARAPWLLCFASLVHSLAHCLPISLPWSTALHHEAIHCYYVLQTRVPQLCPAWLSRCICICSMSERFI